MRGKKRSKARSICVSSCRGCKAEARPARQARMKISSSSPASPAPRPDDARADGRLLAALTRPGRGAWRRLPIQLLASEIGARLAAKRELRSGAGITSPTAAAQQGGAARSLFFVDTFNRLVRAAQCARGDSSAAGGRPIACTCGSLSRSAAPVLRPGRSSRPGWSRSPRRSPATLQALKALGRPGWRSSG